MNNVIIILVAFLATTMAAPTTLPTTARQVSPGTVGICKPAFTKFVILPAAKCFCNALFNHTVSVNVQQRAEADCVAFFGSEEAILALRDPCDEFSTADGSLNVQLLETLLNVIRNKCFPDEDFEVIVTDNQLS